VRAFRGADGGRAGVRDGVGLARIGLSFASFLIDASIPSRVRRASCPYLRTPELKNTSNFGMNIRRP
jgi:hypothetical protein